MIGRFLSRFEDGRHVVYDVPSSSAIADAHAATHGVRVIPRHRFDRADLIVSLDADFLSSTDANEVHNSRTFAESRRPENGQMSRLYVVESTHSATGAAADHRLRMRASRMK